MPIDYAAVVRALDARPPSAYVGYVREVRVPFQTRTEDLLVRVKDGKIVRGAPDEATSRYRSTAPVANPAFVASCYAPVAQTNTTWEGIAAVRFTLAPVCGSATAYPFSELYAERATLTPLYAVGSPGDDVMHVQIAQRFTRVGSLVLPSALSLKLDGHGPMFWLHLDVVERYRDYRFTD